MKARAKVCRDNKHVEFDIIEQDNLNTRKGEQDVGIVLNSSASDSIMLYIDADGKLVVEFVDIDENECIIPICYAWID